MDHPGGAVNTARVKVTLRWDEPALTAAVGQIGDRAARAGAGRIRDRAKRNIQAAGRIDTGALLQSIQARQMMFGMTTRWEIFSPLEYATYQHEGVRPFGPRTAKVLRWKAKGKGGYVFSTRSGGFSGVPFLRDAADQTTIGDFTIG